MSLNREREHAAPTGLVLFAMGPFYKHGAAYGAQPVSKIDAKHIRGRRTFANDTGTGGLTDGRQSSNDYDRD
jgi:hypothetical protein